MARANGAAVRLHVFVPHDINRRVHVAPRGKQEGNVVPITVMKGMPSMPSLGVFPSMETLAAQGILLVLFLFMVVKSFLPSSHPAALGGKL